jgi:AraC-like DNA-binding protein
MSITVRNSAISQVAQAARNGAPSAQSGPPDGHDGVSRQCDARHRETGNPVTTPSTSTVVLIHGLWMTPLSWEHWVERYEARGFTVLTPGYPGIGQGEDGLRALRENPDAVAGLGVREIMDHLTDYISNLDTAPVIMGHSFYIIQHLADPNLGAERIAKAMFISVRQLYKFWEAEHCPLGQWIIERRLEAARDELMNPRGRHQTIAAIASRWGFADATHFSRRFRQAYGMSPREWRHLAEVSGDRDRLSRPAREDCAPAAGNPAPIAPKCVLSAATVG